MAINSDEEILIVDKLDQPIGSGRRSEVLASDSWTRTSSVLVVSDGSVLCHKRATGVDTNPSKWTMTFGGHAAPGETPVQTAIKELKEEIGIVAEPQQLGLVLVYSYHFLNKIKWLFSLEVESDNLELQLEEEEVEETKWVSIKQLKQIYKAKDKDWTNKGFELIAFDLLQASLDNR